MIRDLQSQIEELKRKLQSGEGGTGPMYFAGFVGFFPS
jgi:hypothetical protein